VGDKQYFVHNGDKFKCIVVVSDRKHHETNANVKLSIQLLLASSDQCGYFRLFLKQARNVTEASNQMQAPYMQVVRHSLAYLSVQK